MYRVEWLQSVQLVMLEYWAMANPAVQARITAAVNALDRRLASNPLNEGESRSGNLRVAFESPSGIIFAVDLGRKTVEVVRVWMYA